MRCDSVRALLAEANVKLTRVGGSRVLDSGMLATHDKRAGIGGMQLDTQLEELRNLQVADLSCFCRSSAWHLSFYFLVFFCFYAFLVVGSVR